MSLPLLLHRLLASYACGNSGTCADESITD